MISYLLAQLIDIRIYHFWKNLTKGKHLWLRNNFSTFTSQFIDSFSVIFFLTIFQILDWSQFVGLVFSAFIFKILVAAFIFAMTTVIFHRSRNVVKAYFDVMFPKMSNDAMVEFIVNFGTILLAIATLVFSFSAFKNENLYESLMKLYRS